MNLVKGCTTSSKVPITGVESMHQVGFIDGTFLPLPNNAKIATLVGNE